LISKKNPTEKLFKLAGMLKTSAAKELGAKRHQYLKDFVDQIVAEAEGAR
jgi:hypothetical protein